MIQFGLLDSSEMGLVIRKTKAWLDTWNIQFHLPFSKKERQTGDWADTEHIYMMEPP